MGHNANRAPASSPTLGMHLYDYRALVAAAVARALGAGALLRAFDGGLCSAHQLLVA